jgi:hypothetical protein
VLDGRTMSTMKHATIAAWQRHEDGRYAAELDGWALTVAWHPEGTLGLHGPRRGFTWVAEQAGNKVESAEIFEEIEVAMAAAEARVVADP